MLQGLGDMEDTKMTTMSSQGAQGLERVRGQIAEALLCARH